MSAPHQVEAVALLILHVLEAVLAEPELGLLPIVLRERGEVPGIDFVVPDVDLVHILHLGDLWKAVDGSVGARRAGERGAPSQDPCPCSPPRVLSPRPRL